MTKKSKATSTKHLGLAQRYLAGVAQQHTEAYARSIAKPIAEFTEWCASKGIATLKQVDDKVLARYRRHAEAQGYALSTLRMGLARVQTFLRVSGCKADLRVLRVAHTKKEKRHLAELASVRESEAA
jgi:site-specific recombinase XerD